MSFVHRLLENAIVYRSWQRPFSRAKMHPVVRERSLSQVERVLDVGCGPGTNAPFFRNKQYLGLDINPRYIQDASRRFPELRFQVQDVTQYQPTEDGLFDFVLMNSLLHHINDEHTKHILRQVSLAIADHGAIHILDLVMPEQPCPSRWLARMDRGDYPRPLSAWRRLFESVFESDHFEPYPIKICGVTLWNMVYFRGRPRRG